MVAKIRKVFTEQGDTLLTIVVSLVVSFIIGGVYTWRDSAIQNTKLTALVATVTRIEATLNSISTKVDTQGTDLATHKAATGNGSLNIYDEKGKLIEVREYENGHLVNREIKK